MRYTSGMAAQVGPEQVGALGRPRGSIGTVLLTVASITPALALSEIVSRPLRAPLPDHAAELGAVHSDRIADLVDGGADPRVHGRALHGRARPRSEAQRGAGVRPHGPALRARDRRRLPRPRDPRRRQRAR